MPDLKRILVFTIGKTRHALSLSIVDRVIRVVEITPLPKVPKFIKGVINLHGTVVPVIDLCKRLGLPWREMTLFDRFIIARTSRRTVAILADSVDGIPEISNRDLVSADSNLSFAGEISGLAKLNEELVPIYDLDQFLSLDEEAAIPDNLVGSEPGREEI